MSSSFGLLDPKKQLQEAGYPFNHIGTELTELHGKFEIVSKDVAKIQDEFHKRTVELSDKIVSESKTVFDKIEETKNSISEKMEWLFSRKFQQMAGVVITVLTLLFGVYSFLEKSAPGSVATIIIMLVVGFATGAIFFILGKRSTS